MQELLNYLEKQHIVPPAYSTFQDMIGNCLSEERRRIGQQLMCDLDPGVEAVLFSILSDESPGLPWVTQLKKEPKDFSYKKVLREATRANELKPLYDFFKSWLPSIEISNESIWYYAAAPVGWICIRHLLIDSIKFYI